ncbi:putative EF-Hand 1, calcium-binding protein [Lupinus albus]|uniref:Putative EF-Hand 1, calcium-binding protein n=1 Tax=Lupinus albus TaxID=3870 RepID=A0A6A4QLX4_LUPAL|nr:putative EF-Hand 1, calcium-binding protein [Lupinus albus]
MRRDSIKISPGFSDMSRDMKGSGCDDKTSRAERRWRRRELNCYGTASRTAAKSRGNKAVVIDNNVRKVEDEVDVDNKLVLDTYVSIIDVDNDDHVDGSDIEAKTNCENDNDIDKDNCADGSNIDAKNGYDNDNDIDKDNHADGSNIDANNGYDNDNDDYADPDYKMFLQNLREEGKSYVYSTIVGNKLVCIRYEQEEEEENDDEEKGSTWRDETGNLGTAGSDSIREQRGDSVDSQKKFETEREPCNRRSRSGVSSVPKNNCNTELDIDEDYLTMLNSGIKDYDSDIMENVGTGNLGTRGADSIREQTSSPVESLQSQETEREPRHSEVSSVPKNNFNTVLDMDVDEDYQTFLSSYRACCDNESWVPVGCKLKGTSLSDRRNSQTSDKTFDTPFVQSDYDEDYLLFLNSNPIIDGEQFMGDRNITNVEGGSNSSDSDDLVILEPNQIGENTPFVPSKIFDSSCFENETNQRQLLACDQSLFRRRLMEYLEKPYNQEEYNGYLKEVHRRRHKGRHFETRQGVVKSYPTYGFNKSYLELYPDLEKAISEFKEPRRVLFLLRGFIFWLQNLIYDHDGIFQPWRDESCLEILRKM